MNALFSLAIIGCAVSVRMTIEEENEAALKNTTFNSPPWESRDLKVKLFSWNSGIGLEEIKETFDKLFDESQDPNTADVIITCQQEAYYDWTLAGTTANTASVPGWRMISHGVHKGFAGGAQNAQILRAFVRETTSIASVDSLNEIAAAESRLSWKVKSNEATLMRDTAGVKKPIMKAISRTHATDKKGKGGVSTELVWYADEGAKRKEYRAAFLCAHLDASSEKKRRDGLTKMMLDFKLGADDKKGRDAVKQQVGSGNTCAIWDDVKDCPSQLPNVARYDAIVILGDLNYRLSNAALDDGIERTALPSMILHEEGRASLAKYDPLNPLTTKVPLAELITDVKSGGFGFDCNQPQEKFLPTYKRMGGQACVAVATHGEVDDALECFGEVNEETGEKEIGSKKKDLQLGWLDRVCYRTIGDSNLIITTAEDRGWEATPGAGDKKKGSDHMPVETIMTFTKGCSTRRLTLPTHGSIVNNEGEAASIIENSGRFECEDGYHVVDKQVSPRQIKTSSSTPVVCRDGELQTEFPTSGQQKATAVEQLTCMRICESVEYLSPNPMRVNQLLPLDGANVLLEGESAVFSCGYQDDQREEQAVLVGSPSALCGEDGKFKLAPSLGREAEGHWVRGELGAWVLPPPPPPACLNTCKLNDQRKDLVVSSKEIRGDLAEWPAVQNLDGQHIIAGGSFKMSCRNKNVLICDGCDGQLECLGPGDFLPKVDSLHCVKEVGLEVTDVRVTKNEGKLTGDDHEAVNSTRYYKLKVFDAGKIKSAKDLKSNYFNGEEAEVKFKFRDGKWITNSEEEGKTRDVLVDVKQVGLAGLHLTACDKVGAAGGFFGGFAKLANGGSSCNSVGESAYADVVTVESVIATANEAMDRMQRFELDHAALSLSSGITIKVEFPLKDEGTAVGKVQLTLKVNLQLADQ